MHSKKIIVLTCVLFSSLMITLSPQSTSIVIKNLLAEKIDQSQEISDSRHIVGANAWQEFTPTVKTLKRVEVKLMAVVGETASITLSIEQPLGTILASRELSSSNIPMNSSWVSFDITDISLTLGTKYYIVLSSSANAQYYWYGSDGNPYPNGISNLGSSWDWCFRTYVDKSKSIFTDNLNPATKMKIILIFQLIQNYLKI